jgi:hypothetical protein
MLTLLRVRRVARLWRRPKLDSASRPLHRAGSCSLHFARPAKGAPCRRGEVPVQDRPRLLRSGVRFLPPELDWRASSRKTPPAHRRRQRNGSSASIAFQSSVAVVAGNARWNLPLFHVRGGRVRIPRLRKHVIPIALHPFFEAMNAPSFSRFLRHCSYAPLRGWESAAVWPISA